eukprot:gene29196-32407_t
MSPFEVSSRFAGKGGKPGSESFTTFTVRHMAALDEEEFQVPRQSQPDPPPPVTYSLSNEGSPPIPTGYIRLSSFNARAQADLIAAVSTSIRLSSFIARAQADLIAAVRCGNVIETRANPKDIKFANGTPLTTKPLLVLVNSRTASASEIMAAALQDNCRAVLAGGQTYGKGIIQSVYELSDRSGIAVTVGRYLTPSGRSIDRIGIQPDFSSPPSQKQFKEALSACVPPQATAE